MQTRKHNARQTQCACASGHVPRLATSPHKRIRVCARAAQRAGPYVIDAEPIGAGIEHAPARGGALQLRMLPADVARGQGQVRAEAPDDEARV